MEWLRERNAFGECAEEDAWILAGRVQAFVESAGGGLDVSRVQLMRQILKFVHMRQWNGFNDLSGPGHRSFKPQGWTPHREQVWRDWIDRTFTLEDWQTDVIGPVFGTDERSWEARCTGWRDELFQYLPAWMQRDVGLADAVDLTPMDLSVQDDYVDPRTAKIDPYILERGGGGKFRKRGGGGF